MTQDATTMPDWVLLEAAKMIRWGVYGLKNLRHTYDFPEREIERAFRALCDLILKHEQPPVDRKLLCAREAAAQVLKPCVPAAQGCLEGKWDGDRSIKAAILAIELWEAGHGK